MSKGIGGHQSAKMISDTWLTPPEIITALGPFDLDPCAAPNMPWRTASRMLTVADDGLTHDWTGSRVWLNPPYGREIEAWIRKAYEESKKGSTVVCLVPARTETAWWHDCCLKAEIRFVRGRIHFTDHKGRSGRPRFGSAMVIFRPERPINAQSSD